MISKRYCRSTNYSPLPCKGEPDHDVVYVTSTGRVLDRSPACRLHAIAEQMRHETSGNIATCHVVALDGNVVHA